MTTALAIIVVLLAFSPWAVSSPVFHPTLDIKRVSGLIKIDGNLDDSGWVQAAKIENFVERYPGKNLPPDVATEIRVTYDDARLYIAFRCKDDPSRIRATMCQRDQFNGDDNVALLLDTYGNASWAYEFLVNPYGVQEDMLWSNIIGEDTSFDMVWESAAKITDSGYQVEMAIPFASLRFPNKDTQTWKVDFWRNYPREFDKQYSWAAYNQDDQCWVCQWGTMTGISGVRPGKGMELLPSMVASQSGNLTQPPNLDSHFAENHGKTSMSIGGKYSISSNMTMEATYNPDFSQIEADAAQIDVNSTIALRYPERRPFFQEGSDIFQTPFNSFYSRTINDPQFAGKLTGRSGRFNFGFLSAYDQNTPYIIPLKERSILINTGKSVANIVRASRTIGNNNFFGIILTDRRFNGGGHGTILSTDGVIRLTEKYSMIGQYIYSLTKEPTDSASIADLSGIRFSTGKYDAALNGESFTGDAMVAQFRRQARSWSFVLDYDHASPAYRTETGYDPWNDYRNLTFQSNYDIYPTHSIFGKISPQIGIENRWDFDGRKKWTQGEVELRNNLTYAQTYVNLIYNAATQKWQDIQFNGLWNAVFETGSRFSNFIGYDFHIGYGPNVATWLLQKGNELTVSGDLSLKPLDRLIIEPTLEYVASKQIGTSQELYKQTIGRARIRYQVNREFSLRLVAQYIDESSPSLGSSRTWEFDPLVTYRLSSFSVFYLGSTHNMARLPDGTDSHFGWRQMSRQFFVKLQYLFRV